MVCESVNINMVAETLSCAVLAVQCLRGMMVVMWVRRVIVVESVSDGRDG